MNDDLGSPPTITADDLLAWLRERPERPVVVMESGEYDEHGNSCMVKVTARDGSYHLSFEGYDLVMALEAAVRAVAGDAQ